MSPNGDSMDKEYGEHKYADHGRTSDCEHGCECWMGPFNSGGPVGLNPFGECPNNPKDGERLGGERDYQLVVNRRIRNLEARAHGAEDLLKQVEPGTIELAKQLQDVKDQLFEEK